MAIKIGNIDNDEGTARIGNDAENSELESDALNIEVGDISNQKGNLDVGNKLKGVKVSNKWIGIITAIGTIITGVAGYYFTRSEPPITHSVTKDQQEQQAESPVPDGDSQDDYFTKKIQITNDSITEGL